MRNWTDSTQDRNHWRAIVNAKLILWVLKFLAFESILTFYICINFFYRYITHLLQQCHNSKLIQKENWKGEIMNVKKKGRA